MNEKNNLSNKNIVLEYATICPDFKFYYPNGIPDEAKRCCLECIHLDENHLSQEIHKKQDYWCLYGFRQLRKKAWIESQNIQQVKL